MERNRWETAIRCLEIAVHPTTRDDEVIAAVNGFRRTADGVPLSQVCVEFACGGVPVAELAAMKESLERLNRENRELRRRLAVEEATQEDAAERLDKAHRRIFELTEETAAAKRQAEAAEREFADFRATYSGALEGAHDLRRLVDEARRAVADKTPAPPPRPFSAFLAEARLAADRAASFAGAGNGSGRRPSAGDKADRPWTA
ncbi:MAG TPA: hypothetical protein VMI30_06910 [Stellaceae bacterium]|nr:hypothetical protein [Stellaceae bacterium]